MGSQLTRFGVFAAAITAVATMTVAADQRQLREHRVLVSVLAGDTPITTMKAGEFKITEDGMAREILRVEPAPPPSHLLLLVDDTQVTAPLVQDLRTALTGFIKTMGATAPAPQISLMTFGERPTRRSEYDPKPDAALKAAGRIFTMPGSGSYFLEAVVEVAKDLRKRTAVEPVIVAFVNEGGPEFSNTVATQVADALKATGASLWTIAHEQGAQTVRGDLPGRERANVLGDVTTASGGRNVVILSGQGLTSAFDRTAAALNARYQVTYGRPESLVPPNRLEVTSTRPDVHVYATRWAGR